MQANRHSADENAVGGHVKAANGAPTGSDNTS
jgi:hypothetical protein